MHRLLQLIIVGKRQSLKAFLKGHIVIWLHIYEYSLMGQDLGCMVDVPGHKAWLLECLNSVGHSMSSAFSPNHQLQFVMQHLITVTCTVYCHDMFLLMLKDWPLRIPEKCEHHFSCC
jgi:hypothetical protein